MKKFKFALDTVLSYKQQVLDALRGEHAAILAKVHAQEDVVGTLEQRYCDYNDEYRQRAEEGLPITDVLMYQSGLRAIEMEIQRETLRLEALREAEEKKRRIGPILQAEKKKRRTGPILQAEKKKRRTGPISRWAQKKRQTEWIKQASVYSRFMERNWKPRFTQSP